MKYFTLIITVLLVLSPARSYSNQWDNQSVNQLLNKAPIVAEFPIEYRKIEGLSEGSAWHIGQSSFGIRMHPESIYGIKKLDGKARYLINGIVLEQNYGIIEVWITRITKEENRE